MQSTERPQKASESYIHPYKQAAFGVGLVLVLMFFGAILRSSGMGMPERFAWMAAGATIMMFSIFNSILSVTAPNSMEYWGQSMTSYFVLLVVCSLIAWGVSGQTIFEAGSFAWIFQVLTIGYLVFISLMNVMKNIVNFAMREEWNQPRLRPKNRKKKK